MKYSHDTLELEMAMASDVGQIRQRNEDEVRILPQAGAAVLADGMGGHQAGDVASRLAVEVVAEEIGKWERADQEALAESIDAANQAIRGLASTHPAYRGMGATVVIAVCQDDHLLFSYVGDSRLYRLWNGTLHQLSEDHTLVQQYIKQGMISSAEGKTWAGRNLLTKGLGIEESIEPSFGRATLRGGQTYLLCSDGLTDPVTDEQIAAVLGDPEHSAETAANELVQRANANGGPDNVSVVVIRVREKPGSNEADAAKTVLRHEAPG